MWDAIDVDSKKLIAIDAAFQRSSLNALLFLQKALKSCKNKPLILVDRGPWYPWASERLGLNYEHEKFGLRSVVERFSRYLKERTIVFYHKLSAKDYSQVLKNLRLLEHVYPLLHVHKGVVNLIWTLSARL